MTDPVSSLRRALRETAPDAASRGLLVALSGGADSVALLHLLLAMDFPADRITAAHLDHALRPGSAADAEFAAATARGAGVAFVGTRIDVARRARRGGEGVEAAARRVRYRWLAEAARAAGRGIVLTAHHLDDQAETVLLRVLRGTGPEGLAGIRRRARLPGRPPVDLVRPLLGVRRAALEGWLAARDVPWRTDPTNLDGSNLRSRLRTRLLPRLRHDVPHLDERLAALADLAPAPAPPGSGTDAVRITPILRRALRLLRTAIAARLPADGPPLDRAAMERVRARVADGGGEADLGRGWRARIRGEELLVLPPGAGAPPGPMRPLRLDVPGEVELPDGGRILAEVSARDLPPRPGREVVDLDRAPGPLTVRPVRTGDRFRPLGFDAETSVRRFLMARRVPREERGERLLVLSGNLPVWLVGERIDDRVKRTERTTLRLVLTRR